MQRLCLRKLFLRFRGSMYVMKYDPAAFYICRIFLLNKNILLNKHRFNGAQKYLLEGMANTKQPTVYFGYKHCLNMMVLCIRSCTGKAFDGTDYFHAQIIRAKCCKCKASVLLENIFDTLRRKQDKGNL